MFGELRPVDGGMSILLEKPSITVGHDRTCDVVVEHPSVSANHCLMEFREGHWFIEDQGSRGGIGVNGEKVESAWVPSLSVISIGTIEFDLQYSSAQATTESDGSVSPELLSKLDRALKSVPPEKERRTQVRANQPAPAWVPKTKFGMLIPLDGEACLPLLYDELYLGRDRDCDVILPYLTVANTHCVLRFLEGYWWVRDLHNHGVTIDGKAIQEGWLLPGAVLGVATHLFEMDYSTTAPPPEKAFSISEFEAGDESSSGDANVVRHAAESDAVEIEEFAVIDSDDEQGDNASRVDIDAELEAYNATLTSSGGQPCATEPQFTDGELSGTALAAGSVRMQTPAANDLPFTVSAKPPVITKQQVSVVQPKHERIVQFLKDREFDGLLLSRPASIAWYTGGADVPRGLDGQAATGLLITPEGGTLLARKADRDLLLPHAPSEVGLQHRECAWPRDANDLLADWLGTKKLACDQPFERCADVSSEISALRLPLRPQEIDNLRKLGIRVARTVERAAREFQRGDPEAHIAGDVASRLIRHGVLPVQIQVWGDGRGRGSQNWSYGRETVDHDCTISVVARRHGLHVAVSRTVSFGIPCKELRWTFPDMLMAHATALTSSRDQTELAAVWTQVERVCETLGEAEDWRATDPGCVTGYELCEAPISAKSTLRLQAGMPIILRSLIGPARAVDTILVREADSKVITQTGEWPLIGVAINNEQFFVQTVLQRTA